MNRQLIGVATPDLVETYAAAAQMLGYERLMVVSGDEGLDELSIAGPSKVAMLSGGSITLSSITPEDAGLPCHSLDAIKGGDAAYNAAGLKKMLNGEKGAYRDAVLLNSAGALMVAGAVDSWEEGVEEAGEAIDKGLPMAMLNCWIANQ